MIAMIAVSWAMSTIISIPPLFGLKDPVVDDDHRYDFHPRAVPNSVGDSFDALLIGNHESETEWEDRGSWETSGATNGSGPANETATPEVTNCVIIHLTRSLLGCTRL